MTDEARKLLAVAVAAAVGMTALFLWGPKLLGSAAGPEVEILTELKAAEGQGLELDLGLPAPLISRRVSFDRISVTVEGEERAVVHATLDFDGTLDGTEVSSLGAERVPMASASGDWRPLHGWAPQLCAVVRALERRRAALERGEPHKLCSGRADSGEGTELADLMRVDRRRLQVERWLIRSEKDRVLVTEEWHLHGTLPERPVDQRGARRLVLQAAAAGEFCFPEGLM